MADKDNRSMTGAKEFKKYYRTDRKSKKIEKLDKLNPARALSRIIDDEYEASDSSKYDEVHVGGGVYSLKNRKPEKTYTPQKPRNVGPKVYAKGSGTRKPSN